MLETPRHLFQPTRYQTDRGTLHTSFRSAVENTGALQWDATAVLSLVSFGYVCGNRTLIEGVKRQPWMSAVDDTNQFRLEKIPLHGRAWNNPKAVARELMGRLIGEAEAVCAGNGEKYVLLSGGLDSRIVAGVLAVLVKTNRLQAPPLAVTWGLAQSRDVSYAKAVADRLGFPWQHLELGPEHLRRNLHSAAGDLGAMVSPVNLHRMDWFSTVETRPLVLAGSYGDSVGRSEFSGKTVLELTRLSPLNRWGLLRDEVAAEAARSLMSDLENHRRRSGRQSEYVKCEHEQQGHYMRSHIAHTMNIINNDCTLYQMFTSPEVYTYMWSLHPSVRTNRVYTELLTLLGHGLETIPWARTNRPLRGNDATAQKDLLSKYHDYPTWCGETLYEEIGNLVDPDWFAATGLFCPEALREFALTQHLSDRSGTRSFDTWAWLAVYRLLAEKMELWTRRSVESYSRDESRPAQIRPVPRDSRGRFRRRLPQMQMFSQSLDFLRRFFLRAIARFKFPPEFQPGSHGPSAL